MRQKSGRKTGGQKSHPGSTLEKVANPDHFIAHDFPIHAACSDCDTRLPQILSGSDDWEVRQVFDLRPVALEVTEYRARRCNCPDCGKRITAAFPRKVKAPV